MRINSLAIENFRSIKLVEIKNIGDSILIAGANGCGKTQIYNAIRLLKSVYGGYQDNELQQWFGEFSIRLNQPGNTIVRLFRDQTKPIRIQAIFELSRSERKFLRTKSENMIRFSVWETVAPGSQSKHDEVRSPSALARLQRIHGDEVEERVKNELKNLNQFLKKKSLVGRVDIDPVATPSKQNLHFQIKAKQNPALELIFSIYPPKDLGIIDYHAAQRNYSRQQIGSVNLSIESSGNSPGQHALYNWQGKYSNIKSELASEYVRSLIAGEAGQSPKGPESLIETLHELFARFFPGKTFSGPIPGSEGTLDFPVRLESGAEHDIDDLSSGEKELLFGYLRLRSNAPENSILLIDEPEVHLNPSLLHGLAEFYQKHIGKNLNNQVAYPLESANSRCRKGWALREVCSERFSAFVARV